VPQRQIRRDARGCDQHRARGLPDGDDVDRRRRRERTVDLWGRQRMAHEPSSVGGCERRSHHGRQVVAKNRIGFQ
jgi:hypothetical protein